MLTVNWSLSTLYTKGYRLLTISNICFVFVFITSYMSYDKRIQQIVLTKLVNKKRNRTTIQIEWRNLWQFISVKLNRIFEIKRFVNLMEFERNSIYFFDSFFHKYHKMNIIRTYYLDLIKMMPIERPVNYLNRWEAIFINCNRMTNIAYYVGHVFHQRLEKSVRPKLTMVLTIWMEWNEINYQSE